MKHQTHNKTQRGFTLIELIVVLVIVGILGGILAPNFVGASDTAVASGVVQNASSTGRVWSLLRQQTRVPGTTASNPIATSNNTVLDVLVGGRTFVATAHQRNYDRSSVAVLDKAYKVTTAPVSGTSAGAYTYEGYVTTLSDPATGQLGVVYAAVPTEILELIHADIGTGTFAAATAVTTGRLRYTAAASGTHTVTLVESI